jgi:hypothetical protein
MASTGLQISLKTESFFEKRNSREEIIREFNVKVAMSHGEINNSVDKIRKGIGIGFDRCQEFINEKHNMIIEAISRTTKWEDFNSRMNENFDAFGLFVRNLIEERFGLNERSLNEILLVIDENIKITDQEINGG